MGGGGKSERRRIMAPVKKGEHECPHCQACFTRTHNRNVHAAKCAQKQLGEGTSRGDGGVVIRLPQTGGALPGDEVAVPIFKCKDCSFTSVHRRSVIDHHSRIHSEEGQRRQMRRMAARERRAREKRQAELNRAIRKDRREQAEVAKKYREWCQVCYQPFATKRDYLDHVENVHKPRDSSSSASSSDDGEERADRRDNIGTTRFRLTRSAFQGSIKQYQRIPRSDRPVIDPEQIFRESNLAQILVYEVCRQKTIKVQFSITAEMTREELEDPNKDVVSEPVFVNKHLTLMQGDLRTQKQIDAIIDGQRRLTLQRIEDYEASEGGSGWSFSRMLMATISICQGPRLFSGSAGNTASSLQAVREYIQTNFRYPRNFECAGSYGRGNCLYFAILQYYLGGVFGEDLTTRTRKRICPRSVLRDGMQKLGFKACIGRPADPLKISALEKANRGLNFRLNIHAVCEDTRVVYPYIVSKRSVAEARFNINLLLIDVPNVGSHYVLISEANKQLRLFFASPLRPFLF